MSDELYATGSDLRNTTVRTPSSHRSFQLCMDSSPYGTFSLILRAACQFSFASNFRQKALEQHGQEDQTHGRTLATDPGLQRSRELTRSPWLSRRQIDTYT